MYHMKNFEKTIARIFKNVLYEKFEKNHSNNFSKKMLYEKF